MTDKWKFMNIPFIHIIQRSQRHPKTKTTHAHTHKTSKCKTAANIFILENDDLLCEIIIIKQNAPHQNHSEMVCVIDMYECFKRDVYMMKF